MLLIIAGIFGLIGWLIGRPKGRPGWRNLMTYGKVHPRSATLMASGKGRKLAVARITRTASQLAKEGIMSSKNYAIKDRDGTVHAESGRKEAFAARKEYGGMVVRSKNDGDEWKPYKKRRIFLWVFLAIQAIFIIWLITGSTTSTGPTTAQVAQFCGNGAWQGVFTSYADCVKHGAVGLTEAGNIGKGLGLAVIVIVWVVVDFLVALTYGIYRLARR